MHRLSELLHSTRHRRHWRMLLWVLVAVTAWFAFSPRDGGPQLPGADKIDHMLAFGAMATAAALARRAGWRQSGWSAAALMLYGGLIELVQTQLPTRYGDWADVVADATGAAAGLLAVAVLRRVWPSPRAAKTPGAD